MNFFLKKNKKNKKNLCGAVPRTPQRDPQNLCLQGKWMPLTLRLAFIIGPLARALLFFLVFRVLWFYQFLEGDTES